MDVQTLANNQVVITDSGQRTFFSYGTAIAQINKQGEVLLDEEYWNYSRTTSKYRGRFLGESTDATRKKIASGRYILTNLNG